MRGCAVSQHIYEQQDSHEVNKLTWNTGLAHKYKAAAENTFLIYTLKGRGEQNVPSYLKVKLAK